MVIHKGLDSKDDLKLVKSDDFKVYLSFLL